MNPKIVIRNETPDDVCAITEVTIAAFKTLEISNHTEQFIIGALRAANALTVSLVAELDGRVVGHVAFSPVTISDSSPNWYGLGPVSVLPEHQREGIGTSLIQEGLSRLRGLGARGCCLVGDPKYYQRLGFRNVSGLVHEGVPPRAFLVLPFKRHLPRGTVTFHKGFLATGQREPERDDPDGTISASPGNFLLKRVLLVCGILSSLLYASIDALAGTLYVGYSHTSQAFSELLSPGSPVRQLALQLGALYGVLLLAFALGVRLAADRNRALRVTALMVFGQAVDGLVTPVYFPAPMRGVAGAESAGILHTILTAVGVFTILLAIVFGAVAYRNWFRHYSVGSLLVILAFGLIGFSYLPAITANLPTPWLGATERVNIYGWMLWVAVLAIILLRMEKGPASARMQTNQGESK